MTRWHEVVRDATADDVPAIAAILAAGLADSTIGAWLLPNPNPDPDQDPDRHNEAWLPYASALVDHALDHGWVHIVAGRRIQAVAVWLPVSGQPDAPDHPARLAKTTLPDPARVQKLAHAAREHTPPVGSYHHLAALAVHPDRRRRGVSGALLRRHHRTLDHQQLPAIVHTTASSSLLLRHGYLECPPYRIAVGLRLVPMVRLPRPEPGRPTSAATRPAAVRHSVTVRENA